MRERFARTATELLDADQQVCVVLGEISVPYFEEAIRSHPNRVVNVGIMEQAMVGVAAGMAMEGFRPFVHTITPFLTERPLEQVKLDFGYQRLGGTFVSVGASYDYSTEGATHHSPGDVQVMLSIPGMRVLVPGHPDELDELMRKTYADGQPTYIRTSTSENREALRIEPGRLTVVREGVAATVLAVGPVLSRTLDATEGLDVTVLYATSVRPFDAEALRRRVQPGSTVFIVEPFYEGTTALEISAALADRAVRLVSIGVPRRFVHNYGTPEENDAALMLDILGIRGRLQEALSSE